MTAALALALGGTVEANHMPTVPKLDKLSHLRGSLNTIHKNKCLAPRRYRWTLWQVPVHMRSYVNWQTEKVFIPAARARESQCVPWYVTKQIWAANILARDSLSDPWPNCPDPGPRDNQGPGHSWTDTVGCENGGNWLDSPGFYRCGLQFHPNWEKVFGRLCP